MEEGEKDSSSIRQLSSLVPCRILIASRAKVCKSVVDVGLGSMLAGV